MGMSDSAYARDQGRARNGSHDAAAISRLRLGILRVARRIRQDARTSLPTAQQSVVVWLDRYDAMSLGELASAEGVRPPTMTRTIQALEAAGMVRRHDPKPGSRRVEVELTDTGRLAAIEIHEQRDAWLSTRMAALTADEREALSAATPVLERLLRD